ncbi:maleylpyruvate isomerase family mycothiol-dependent enzyme [Frankia sp. CNm7]|uniref:Maleylpyruvate isomerase family mycothiol-dependent enzyme n=1 Tax=Frankia nepalensis TaxID=1836974 RepID=A0A937RH85_9ACTN|nr:maleylpyruvate isomerase family mycothiol-dependent enzyme [Frankia nepalensis]MBL7514993.1 maleylpyruvate isomerase family mycothiol-dependent enzyme [Frankia nepalensis]MBL7518672.1 maleylpyruvate isomerase family mycothiol-dependent enzyme [Frankia nepalensis]MBL7628930.1 maleylpyruvate isomerase family mycothiol-dependent enzyme [Frankia nepalensis]
MDSETSWKVIAEQRRALGDLLDGLPPGDWDAPSLCARWRVRDVAAHVALAPQPPSPVAMAVAGLRARGRFHRLNHDLAVRHADTMTGEQLVAELRRFADSRRLPAVTNYRNILFDVLVHGQDVAIPLGRPLPMPPAAATAALERVWTMGWPFWARRRLRGVRLRATDGEWSAGEGSDVQGPLAALLLLATGRPAALPHLTGDGVPLLRGLGHLAPTAAAPRDGLGGATGGSGTPRT